MKRWIAIGLLSAATLYQTYQAHRLETALRGLLVSSLKFKESAAEALEAAAGSLSYNCAPYHKERLRLLARDIREGEQ